MAIDKNSFHRNKARAIKQTTTNAAGPAKSARTGMKKQGKTEMPSKIEREYSRLFPLPQVPDAPQQTFYADDYNLAQPSTLKYVPSITTPNAEE